MVLVEGFVCVVDGVVFCCLWLVCVWCVGWCCGGYVVVVFCVVDVLLYLG